MSSISIVGGMGCGKSTALGLLHEALTSYAVRSDDFRFEPDLMCTSYLYDEVCKPMRSGDFPAKTLPGSRREVKLNLKSKKRLGGWKVTEINSYDVSGEDIMEALEQIRKAKTIQEVIAGLKQREILSALLTSEVFIFLVDALSCDPSNSKEAAYKKAENDFFLSKLWIDIKEYKKKTKWNIKGVGIIFTKYDVAQQFLPLGPTDYYEVVDLNRPVVKGSGPKVENKSFVDIIRTYLPSTYTSMRYDIEKIQSENTGYFKSGMLMKMNEETGQAGLCIPLTFSVDEYIRLARWISQF